MEEISGKFNLPGETNTSGSVTCSCIGTSTGATINSKASSRRINDSLTREASHGSIVTGTRSYKHDYISHIMYFIGSIGQSECI